MTLRQIAGWTGLWGAALAASFSPMPVQLIFAIVAIGVIGMAHGASDLAVVKRGRKVPFLAAYGVIILLCLFWWHWSPALALPGFLLASALHFALEDAPKGAITERLARGVSMIATPALFHPREYNIILHHAGLAPTLPGSVTLCMAIAGALCAISLLITGVSRHDVRLMTGTLALLLLPPFVGFSMGFLILHALPQTRLRRLQLGYAHYTGYLYATWPVFAGAILLAAVTTCMMYPSSDADIKSLFAALASLAIPHMLVTPYFEPGSHE
ncbi:hypothetical protein GC090_12565 [Pantoea sp. JZ29]|uniref:Brp/Blh family beta-carotene 15,15'-dioxygenase n=1 Tax=Pantoea sp. JZ29 TaxID=2654192 RepID=UPI002B48E523|nr:Brp/Blh family beta-carotene 15,15'-dioxygenase [Pantoea sp. JZ29]WRH21434.1 hypothetical protein GC090_12565 [Pantoea sp. JZ29]